MSSTHKKSLLGDQQEFPRYLPSVSSSSSRVSSSQSERFPSNPFSVGTPSRSFTTRDPQLLKRSVESIRTNDTSIPSSSSSVLPQPRQELHPTSSHFPARRMMSFQQGYASPNGYSGYSGNMMSMNPMMMMGGHGPFQLIHNINYFIYSIGHLFDFVGYASYGLLETCKSLLNLLKRLEMKIRSSEFRRWLQKKSRKSAMLRFLFLLCSVALSFQLSNLIKHFLLKYISKPVQLLPPPVT
jgi:hypothetical protein